MEFELEDGYRVNSRRQPYNHVYNGNYGQYRGYENGNYEIGESGGYVDRNGHWISDSPKTTGGGIGVSTTSLVEEEADDDARLLSQYHFKRHPAPPPPVPIYNADFESSFANNSPGPPSTPRRKMQSLFGTGRMSDTQKRWFRMPWFCWIVSVAQVCVFIAELARMGQLTGSPIQTKPSFNPMVGPSTYLMINMGARFTPCMHRIANITDNTDLLFPCPNSTSTDTDVCSLSELCGMGATVAQASNGNAYRQWWRFIVPMFLHAGFVHIGFNLLLQLTLGSDLEKEIGHVRFIVVYFASGISGFVLGGNLTPDGIASTGCSGALFGAIAIDLLDLLYFWRIKYTHPYRNLLIHISQIVICFVLGLLPGLDNFSHIGGFAMGLLVGTALLPTPHTLWWRTKAQIIAGQPAKLAKPRSRRWYAWIVVRVACLALAIVYFAMLIHEFFSNGGVDCSWCKYLSCLPVHDWCDLGNITT